jgi:hypothetical protein
MGVWERGRAGTAPSDLSGGPGSSKHEEYEHEVEQEADG